MPLARVRIVAANGGEGRICRSIRYLILVASALVATAVAAGYPEKPIRVIYPFAAGGSGASVLTGQI